MKKKILSLLTFAVTALVCAPLTSCGDDDEGDNVVSNSSQSDESPNPTPDYIPLLTGNWYTVDESDDAIVLTVITVNADGTWTQGEYTRSSSDNFTTTHTDIVQGTFYLDDQNIIATANGGKTRKCNFSRDALLQGRLVMVFPEEKNSQQQVLQHFTAGSPEEYIAQIATQHSTRQQSTTLQQIAGTWLISSYMRQYYDSNGNPGTLYMDLSEDHLVFSEDGIMSYMEKGSSGTYHEDGTTTFSVKNGELVFDSSKDVDHVVVYEMTDTELDIEIWWAKKSSGGQNADRCMCYKIQ